MSITKSPLKVELHGLRSASAGSKLRGASGYVENPFLHIGQIGVVADTSITGGK